MTLDNSWFTEASTETGAAFSLNDHGADDTTRQCAEYGVHAIVAAVPSKHERKDRCADQNEKHHAADFQRCLGDVLEAQERNLTPH